MLTKKEAPKNEVKSKLPKTTASAPSLAAKPVAKAPPVQVAKNLNSAKATSSTAKQKTRVIVKCDVGFHNQVYIRGKGSNLCWEKGLLLKNIKSDEWVWETEGDFSTLEFKVLINDRNYESGENHTIKNGSSVIYTPRF